MMYIVQVQIGGCRSTRTQVAIMSTWNLGANDVSEETRTFRDKLASKGMLSDVRLRTSGLLELQMVKSLLRKTD